MINLHELPRKKVKSLKDNIFFFLTIGVIAFLALLYFGIKFLNKKQEMKEEQNIPNITEKQEEEETPKEPIKKEEISKEEQEELEKRFLNFFLQTTIESV